MSMEKIEPRLKLISKRDFEEVRDKYTFTSGNFEKIIDGAQSLDVLALTVMPGSGLKVLDVKILNEKKEEVFIKLLKEGAVTGVIN